MTRPSPSILVSLRFASLLASKTTDCIRPITRLRKKKDPEDHGSQIKEIRFMINHIWYGLFLVMSSRLQHIVTFAYGHTKIRDFPTWNTPASPLLPKTCPHVVSYHEISYSFIITTPTSHQIQHFFDSCYSDRTPLDISILRHRDNIYCYFGYFQRCCISVPVPQYLCLHMQHFEFLTPCLPML